MTDEAFATPAEASPGNFEPAIFGPLLDEVMDVEAPRAGDSFPDRAAGAREMRRVLVDGGRAVIATWKGLDRHLLYAALTDAEEPHLRALDAEVTRDELEVPFSLGDPDRLRGLLTEAGFSGVRVVERSITATFATPDRFAERLEFAYAAVVPSSRRIRPRSTPTSGPSPRRPGTSWSGTARGTASSCRCTRRRRGLLKSRPVRGVGALYSG